MSRNIETALVRNMMHVNELYFQMSRLFLNSSFYDQMFPSVADALAKFGLVMQEYGSSIVLYPMDTRLKKPPFISVSRGQWCKFETNWYVRSTNHVIEFVEGGKYAVAGESEEAEHRGEAKSTALQF